MKKSRRNKFKLSPRSKLSAFIAILVIGYTWLASSLVSIPLPQTESSPLLYSNQTRDDLRQTFVSAIKKATSSIELIIYGLSDAQVINALKQKAEEGVAVEVICDPKASQALHQKLGPKITTSYHFSKGLMHQKILIIDQKQLWIGSANMTSESLRIHANLVAGMECPPMAEMLHLHFRSLKSHSPSPQPRSRYIMGGQQIELSLLPDDRQAFSRLIGMLDGAKKSIRVAMYTWTHPRLTQAVIDAKRRGIKVEAILDYQSAKGTSAHTLSKLLQAKIPARISRGPGLLHHKFVLIDGNCLVSGSANWTKAAFTKNVDCMLVIEELSLEQQQKMEEVWKILALDSTAK